MATKTATKTAATDTLPATPAEYIKAAAEAGEQFLTTLQEGQNAFLEAAGALASAAPTVPAVPTLGEGLVVELPSPREVAKVNFDFAEKLLAQQKSYVEKLLAVGEQTS